MHSYKTLREVCDCLHISRRAIQGYAAHGLVKPSGKNKYGHLLYDEEAIQLIEQIKQYQRFGFKLKEIKALQSASATVQKDALLEKLTKLKEMRDELDVLIDTVHEMIQKL